MLADILDCDDIDTMMLISELIYLFQKVKYRHFFHLETCIHKDRTKSINLTVNINELVDWQCNHS